MSCSNPKGVKDIVEVENINGKSTAIQLKRTVNGILVTLTIPYEPQPSDKEIKIKEIEEQIESLKKKVGELRDASN